MMMSIMTYTIHRPCDNQEGLEKFVFANKGRNVF